MHPISPAVAVGPALKPLGVLAFRERARNRRRVAPSPACGLLAPDAGRTRNEETVMAKEILSEELWQRVDAPHRRRVPGPEPIDDRSVLVGILFVLKTGLPWEELPAEMGPARG